MRYMVLDLETQSHKVRKRVSNPFHPENWIVLRGWKMQGDARCSWERFDCPEDVTPLDIPEDCNLIVAHNAKFELLYELRFSPHSMRAFFKRGGRIWCTQYAEYLLNAQHEKSMMTSLNDLAVVYGGRKKIDGIKELWQAGVLTADIDPDLLLDYLVGTEEEQRDSGDVGNTELIFRGQVRQAKAMDMLRALMPRMDSLCGTSEMEFNGLQIDVGAAKEDCIALMQEENAVRAKLDKFISFIPEEVNFNWASLVHKSALLFGGTIKYKKSAEYIDPDTGELARFRVTEKWPLFRGWAVDPKHPRLVWNADTQKYSALNKAGAPVYQDEYLSGKKMHTGKFKNVRGWGETKTKIQDFYYELPGVTEPEDEWKGKLVDGIGRAIYSTSGDVIEALGTRDIPFLKDLSRAAFLAKEIGTYYIRVDDKGNKTGMLTCVGPDGRVHHTLNVCNTKTTRLSSQDPNLQNTPRAGKSKVKRMFVSRFGPDGCMIEADYSQLEVVVQGLLSLDPQLCEDLRNQIDFHCKRVSLKYNVPYEFAIVACKDESHPEFALWKSRRTGVKEFSFQRAYGAGAAAISAKTGIPKADIEAMIEAEELEYPGIVRFNQRVAREVEETAEKFRDGQNGWREYRRGYYRAPTGCVYNFRSHDAPSWLRRKGIVETFKPTELKNYPIQGTGGEIVQMVLGVLWRWFISKDNYNGRAYLVNTVHDCFWVDAHHSVLKEVARDMKRIMQEVPRYLHKFYGMDCPVPFPVEVEAGPNMLDLHHISED